MNSAQTVEVIVRLYIEKDADVNEVLQEMDYSFKYPGILATEIVDVNTEIWLLYSYNRVDRAWGRLYNIETETKSWSK